MAEVTELVTKFSFTGSTEPLNKYNAALGSSIGLLGGFAAAGVAAAGAIFHWANGVLSTIDPLINLKDNAGLAVEMVQELGFAADLTSSSHEALESSLVSLSIKIGEAAEGGAKEFELLGLSVKDSMGQVKAADTVLFEVGKRFKELGTSKTEQQNFADKLGIDKTLLALIGSTTEEVEALRAEAREYGVLTTEQVEQAQAYGDQLARLNRGFQGIRNVIAVGLAPEMQNLVDGFIDLLKANRGWMIDGIQSVIGVLGDFIRMVVRVAPFIAAIGVGFVAAKIYAVGFAGVIAALSSPILIVAAAVAAVVLVLDDLIVFFQGGDSITGQIWEDLKTDIDEFVKYTGQIANLIVDQFSAAWDNLKKLTGALKDYLMAQFTGWFDWMVGKLTNLATGITSLFTSTPAPQQNSAGFDGSFRPGGNVSNQNQTSNSTVQQTNNIEIKTNNPAQAGKMVNDNLQRQMADAQTQSKRGGR